MPKAFKKADFLGKKTSILLDFVLEATNGFIMFTFYQKLK
jgi:hypothetical protein